MTAIYNLRSPLHNAGMRRGKSLSDWRALAFAVALFAVTLNFLQPLVHAALMRDGAPSTLWTVFCNAAPDSRQDMPLSADKKHECCLGLAHAVALAAPAAVFTVVAPIATAVRPLQSLDRLTPVGIRDGPHRPRGPPAFV
jgi:hypothetical protein